MLVELFFAGAAVILTLVIVGLVVGSVVRSVALQINDLVLVLLAKVWPGTIDCQVVPLSREYS